MTTKGSMIDDVISSIFVPGTNSGLVKAMTASFFGLFITLIGMLWLTSGNLHVWALFGLSLGTFGSIRWFVTNSRVDSSLPLPSRSTARGVHQVLHDLIETNPAKLER